MEEWVVIEGCNNYEISNFGNIRNISTGKYLKTSIDRYGYEKIQITKNNGSRLYTTIHRLVANAWVLNIDINRIQVNHKDGIKTNNYYKNLEWNTPKENINHSYDKRLNENLNPVILIDLDDDIEIGFRSIKSLSKYLNTYSSVLCPLIKNSENNPYLSRYIIKIIDEEKAFELPNTLNFGISIYVYDVLTNTIKTYPSILLASYFTGLRCLGNFRIDSKILIKNGYYISYNIENLPNNLIVNKEEILKERNNYLNIPYTKRDFRYYLYDYYLKKEYEFSNVSEVKEFLDNIEPLHQIVKLLDVSFTINRGHGHKKSGLIKGMGIKSTKNEYGWFPYPEENILRNKYNKLTYTVYKVKIDNNEVLLFGDNELCNYCNYTPDKSINKFTIDDILQSTNIPNLSIVRLIKPLI